MKAEESESTVVPVRVESEPVPAQRADGQAMVPGEHLIWEGTTWPCWILSPMFCCVRPSPRRMCCVRATQPGALFADQQVHNHEQASRQGLRLLRHERGHPRDPPDHRPRVPPLLPVLLLQRLDHRRAGERAPAGDHQHVAHARCAVTVTPTAPLHSTVASSAPLQASTSSSRRRSRWPRPTPWSSTTDVTLLGEARGRCR